MLTFFEKTGKMALGSRLRILSDRITEESMSIYDLYDVGLKPKWFPVFYTLTSSDPQAVTDLAREIGHSHPSVVRTLLAGKANPLAAAKGGHLIGKTPADRVYPAVQGGSCQ